MKKLTFAFKIIVLQTVPVIGFVAYLYAGDLGVSVVVAPDIEFQDSSEVPLEPKIETIRISPEMLLPKSSRPVYIHDVREQKRPGFWERFVKNVICFGWVGRVKNWISEDPVIKESEKEKKLREEWETRMGRDYFSYYYKYEEAQEYIEENTTWLAYDIAMHPEFDLFSSEIELQFEKREKIGDFKSTAKYNLMDQDIEVKFKRKF